MPAGQVLDLSRLAEVGPAQILLQAARHNPNLVHIALRGAALPDAFAAALLRAVAPCPQADMKCYDMI